MSASSFWICECVLQLRWLQSDMLRKWNVSKQAAVRPTSWGQPKLNVVLSAVPDWYNTGEHCYDSSPN